MRHKIFMDVSLFLFDSARLSLLTVFLLDIQQFRGRRCRGTPSCERTFKLVQFDGARVNAANELVVQPPASLAEQQK